MPSFFLGRRTILRAAFVVVLLLAGLVSPIVLDRLDDQPQPTETHLVQQARPAPVPASASVAEAAESQPASRPAAQPSPGATPPGQPKPSAAPPKAPGVPHNSLQAAAAAVTTRYPAGRAPRVGIQAGHWQTSSLPDELASLRKATGAAEADWKEMDLNLDVARRVTQLLSQAGVAVDLIPATVPVHYRANAFVSIHADANKDASLSGFKAARATKSTNPRGDDSLVASVSSAYRSATGLAWHGKTITQNMVQYYAFDQKFSHSVDPTTPAVILEMGFLSNDGDRGLMLGQRDVLAQAVTLGVLNFLAK